MKKVAQVLYSGLGGHGSVAFSIIKGLEDCKHHLIFFGVEPLIDDYKEKCESAGITYQYFHTSERKQLAAYLGSLDTDVLINHTIQITPILALVKKKYKVICVEHDPLNMRKGINKIFSVIGYFISDHMVILTEKYREFYKKILPFSSLKKLSLIPNGIDVEKYSPQIKSVNAPLIITMISRLSHTKDHLTLIKGLRLFLDQHPEYNNKISVKIAGDGTEYDKVKNEIETLDLSNVVTLLGMLSEDEIVSILKESHFYTHCSFSETMPTSIMQALSSGLPCYVSNIDGNRQLVTPVNEFFYEAGNPASYAENFLEFLQTENYKERTETVRSFAVNNLSLQKMAASYKSLF